MKDILRLNCYFELKIFKRDNFNLEGVVTFDKSVESVTQKIILEKKKIKGEEIHCGNFEIECEKSSQTTFLNDLSVLIKLFHVKRKDFFVESKRVFGCSIIPVSTLVQKREVDVISFKYNEDHIVGKVRIYLSNPIEKKIMNEIDSNDSNEELTTQIMKKVTEMNIEGKKEKKRMNFFCELFEKGSNNPKKQNCNFNSSSFGKTNILSFLKWEGFKCGIEFWDHLYFVTLVDYTLEKGFITIDTLVEFSKDDIEIQAINKFETADYFELMELMFSKISNSMTYESDYDVVDEESVEDFDNTIEYSGFGDCEDMAKLSQRLADGFQNLPEEIFKKSNFKGLRLLWILIQGYLPSLLLCKIPENQLHMTCIFVSLEEIEKKIIDISTEFWGRTVKNFDIVKSVKGINSLKLERIKKRLKIRSKNVKDDFMKELKKITHMCRTSDDVVKLESLYVEGTSRCQLNCEGNKKTRQKTSIVNMFNSLSGFKFTVHKQFRKSTYTHELVILADLKRIGLDSDGFVISKVSNKKLFYGSNCLDEYKSKTKVKKGGCEMFTGGYRFRKMHKYNFDRREYPHENEIKFVLKPEKMSELIKICEYSQRMNLRNGEIDFMSEKEKFAVIDRKIQKKIDSISKKLNQQIKIGRERKLETVLRFECSKDYFLINEKKIERILSGLVRNPQEFQIVKIIVKHYRLTRDLENIMFIFSMIKK